MVSVKTHAACRCCFLVLLLLLFPYLSAAELCASLRCRLASSFTAACYPVTPAFF